MNVQRTTKRTLDPGIRVTLLGIAVNVVLVIVKLSAGLLIGSVALLADGIHSASDVATDLAILGGIRLAVRPADLRHSYGHGRYETFLCGLVAVALILTGLYISWEAVDALHARVYHFPGPFVLIVAGLSIFAKEWVYRRIISVARHLRSPALHANAWHQRTDALSSFAVFLGGVGGLVGWGHADQAAGVLVGLMVIAVGGRIARDVFHELAEGSLSREELAKISRAVEQVPQVRSWHELRTRSVGRETFVDLHVLVNPDLSLLQGHRISMQVEEAVKAASLNPVNVIVRVEPDTPELPDHHSAN